MDSLVLRHRPCQAMGPDDSLHRATPPCSLDAQQDHPEGHRELQNHARAEGISADIEDKIKEKIRNRQITVHWKKSLSIIPYKTTTLSNICGTFVRTSRERL